MPLKKPLWTLFAACTPGMEPAVLHELTNLTDARLRQEEGGVELEGELLDAAGLCLWARTPSGILVRAGRFRAKSLQQLYQETKKVSWMDLIAPGQPIEVRATVKGSRIQRSDNAARKIKLAVSDAMKGARRLHSKRVHYPVTIVARIRGAEVTLSLDAVGQPLHRRGYRQATAKAPLRENLAAAILVAVDWDPEREALADPMCGSGTFAIEAALLAQDRAPGKRLRPAVVDWPSFPKKGWEQLKQQVEAPVLESGAPIFASDRNPGAVRAATENAQRAGVGRSIRFRCSSLEEAWDGLPQSGLVVVNPPYGKRIGDPGKLHALYKQFGRSLSERYPGWRIAVVCPDKALAGRLAPGIEERIRFRNGGLAVGLYQGTIPPHRK
ncbi:MAG: hypothetical protein VXW32_07730 [Myxococcota bacterium]|nr:hypothetical protein [Myxococcota bacterium]